MLRALKTQSQGKPFQYQKTERGVKIVYGGKPWTYVVPFAKYARLLETFKGRTVVLGRSRTRPPRGSVGEWLQQNVTKIAIATYLGPILVAEVEAEWAGDYSLKFS